MAISWTVNWLSFLLIISSVYQSPAHAVQMPYIVFLKPDSYDTVNQSSLDSESHFEFLGGCLKSKEKAREAILYSYTRFINGFAATLEEEAALEISKHPGVVSVLPSKEYKPQTTHSWSYLGLERNGMVPKHSLWEKARFGEDVIIANLDFGVWPESPSFNDEGMGPIPPRWKGICQNDSEQKFSCNRKLIGVRYLKKGFEAMHGKLNSSMNNPRDTTGHGTHTLSTAVGAFVPIIHSLTFSNFTAKGGAPRGRAAAYKVCWSGPNSCVESDILSGFEFAINDGVDVISMSLSMKQPYDARMDSLIIGSFHAIKNRITVVSSAGNYGPFPGSVSNTAPWMLTVAASTTDRDFAAYVLFGNQRLRGLSLSRTALPEGELFPLICSTQAKATNASLLQAEYCRMGSLDAKKVQGKIVVCLRGEGPREEKGEVVKLSGGVGMILVNNGTNVDDLFTDFYSLPAAHISYSDGLKLLQYMKSQAEPKGYITPPRAELTAKPAPIMAGFSSQGPNPNYPHVLKPDITAPGVNIFAAAKGHKSPSGIDGGVEFEIFSGTSMSSPHIAGIVGLLKKIHPDWSPAAIKSAIMTTARTNGVKGEIVNATFRVEPNPFSYGAGHVQPNRAADPGLVYDTTTIDYLNFLCAIGHNSSLISLYEAYTCPGNPPAPEDLNYPSITVPYLGRSITVTRKVKNVGGPGTYVARIQSPKGVMVIVQPKRLRFENIGEEKTFQVMLAPKKGHVIRDYVFGSLSWSDGDGGHYVRSPIAVKLMGI